MWRPSLTDPCKVLDERGNLIAIAVSDGHAKRIARLPEFEREERERLAGVMEEERREWAKTLEGEWVPR